MKILMAVIILSLTVLSLSATAQTGMVNADYVDFLTKDNYDEFQTAARNKDYRQRQALLDTLRC